MEIINENEKEKVFKTIFVFNLIKSSRTTWHRHYVYRCKLCNTFLVIKCDKTMVDGKICDIRTHSIEAKESYKVNESPDHIEEEIKEFKWNDCKEHFTR